MINIKNISNVYSVIDVNEISNAIKYSLEQSHDSICGLEIKITQNTSDFILITPPFLRKFGHIKYNYNKSLSKTYKYYEGYLYNPFFLPIYDELDGEFIEKINLLNSSILNNEMIYIQWLFSKSYNWKNTALQMYSSYILGNDYPNPISLIRRIQDTSLSILSKVNLPIDRKKYIDEAERKIISEGYRFELRISINCHESREKYLIKKIKDILKLYDSFNSIQLVKIKNDNFISNIQNCTLTISSKYQILSKHEILSLFGGNELVADNINNTDNSLQNINNTTFELLPKYETEIINPKENLIQSIAESLKRVGLIEYARVYEPKITVGVRLTIIQFNIPKSKNLTDIIKKTKDIQATLGINSLSIEQGNKPDTVKFMIPNENPTIVSLGTLLENESFKEYTKNNKLPFIVGIDEFNNPIYLSLTKLPHLLVAGSTGSGKSVFINTLAVTLILMNNPQELEIYMIDPKMVEFQHFKDFPHVKELITDMNKAVEIFNKLVDEMEERYKMFNKIGVNHIEVYNEKIKNEEIKGEILPYKVVIVDEFADLMDTNKEVDEYIARLGQKARSAGIHLIIATQRPSADVINGRIKSNILNVISFVLADSINYRTVFGKTIPYTLLNNGDGVLREIGANKEFQRFQAPIISIDKSETENILKQLAKQLNDKYGNAKQRKEIITENKNEQITEDENLIKLKQVIANTKITKTSELREILQIKNTTLSKLMSQLVEEGFLEKGKSKKDGHKIVASEEELNKWRN